MKVFIIAVMTADGYIGKDEHHLATSWTSRADKIFFSRTTKQAGTVVMGRKTYQTFSTALPKRRLIVLTSDPNMEVPQGVEATNENPIALIERLKNEGTQAVALAGGASVYAQFMQANLVDELYLNVEPHVFGSGVPLFGQPHDQQLELLDTQAIGDGVAMLHYRVAR